MNGNEIGIEQKWNKNEREMVEKCNKNVINGKICQEGNKGRL